MARAIDIIKSIKDNKKNLEFLPTGFPKLDEFLDGGFMRKELIVLGAYTGVGKSYIAGSILFNIAKAGFITSYFSLEISNEMVVSRLIGSLSNIKPTRVMSGWLSDFEQSKRIEAESAVEGLNELMDFHDGLYDFGSIVKKIKDEGYEFIVIDFVQNIISNQQDEYSRLSQISLQLQKVAKETNSCILLLSQLSNEAAKRDSMEYKGSGSIATVCDLGFFIKRSEVSIDNDNQVQLILRKNRRGVSGKEFTFSFRQPGGYLTEL